jgi:hypothetical protein
LVEKHPGYPQELMLWMDTQQEWYWYAGSEDSPYTIHPVQPHCLGITKVLIKTCMLDTLGGPYKVYFCHAFRRPILHFFNSHVNTTKIIFSIGRKLVAYSWLVSYSLFITYSLFAIPYFIQWISIKLGEYINNWETL